MKNGNPNKIWTINFHVECKFDYFRMLGYTFNSYFMGKSKAPRFRASRHGLKLNILITNATSKNI